MLSQFRAHMLPGTHRPEVYATVRGRILCGNVSGERCLAYPQIALS